MVFAFPRSVSPDSGVTPMTRFPWVFRPLCLVAAIALAIPSMAFAEEWGTIKGRFVFGGAAPTPAELKADKDVEVCGKHKLLAEELVVGADKGVANVVVFVRDKGVKVNPDAAKSASAKVVLDNKDCRFEPHVAFVQVGQELVVKNSDTVGHNSNIATVKNAPSNNLIPAGGEAAVKFTSDEAVPAQVTCNIHPWMKSWLVVRPNPYAAVSKADGTFEIKDVPVGEVELQFWHEKAGYLTEMKIGGKDDKAPKGRKKVAVAAAGTDLGEIELAPGVFQK
jgi:plastocyanin